MMYVMTAVFSGAFTGVLSGLLGIGGGAILVVVSVFLLGLSQHMAQAAAILAMVLGAYLGLPGGELALLAITIAAVLVAEMFNTAVEALVDIVSPGYHPLAKVAKDVAAGGVLVTAIVSLVVGYLLFIPRLFG